MRTSEQRQSMNPLEFQLLLHSARSCPDAESIRGLVRKGVDWPILLTLAARHCVRPLLLQTLKSVCWDAVPLNTQLELTRFNKANVKKNLLFTAELLRLLSLFQQSGIPIAGFKGPILAHSIYGNMSLREFSDLDVIVHKTDLTKAEDILAACGYQADFADKDYRSAFLSYQRQYAFRDSNTGISVDLHWQLSSKGVAFPLKLPKIWPRLVELTIAGRTVLTLAHDDLALFLAAHGTKEGWRSLIWVCDFAELLRKCHDIDWLEVFDRAHRSHSSRSLLLAINLASTLLDAPTPADLIVKARANSAVRALAEKAQLRLLSAAPQGELSEFLNSLNTYDCLRHRLWPVVTLLTTRTVGDYQAMPLPKSLWGSYYLIRPCRLAYKAAKMMLASKLSQTIQAY
jgi:Uncharacterised nucleotidyltransferase